MDPQRRFAERLASLRQRFIAALPDRLATMRNAVGNADRERLQYEAHRLAGTGTSYDLPELTAWGRGVEAQCRQGAPLAELTAELDALAAMIAAVSPASSGPRSSSETV